ncbi:MAG TPA: hypothetical protein VFT46_07115 [Holophagaceae bacterium]|nr:hypothetical protein [Holophagaceae bacterium]
MTAARQERMVQRAAVDLFRALREALQTQDPDEVFQPDPWGDEELEDFGLEEDWGPDEEAPGLEGLGSFLKKAFKAVTKVVRAPIKLISPKLASNMEKIDNKIIDNLDSIHTKINDAAKKLGKSVAKALGKNWKWIAVVAAIAITIYTMGSGATIAAHMLSGMQALGHAIATGAAAVGHAVASGASTVGHFLVGGSAAGAGAAGAAGASTAAGVGAASSGWIATAGKLALSAASALYNKAKVSDLSQAQAQAMLQAQEQGVNLGADDPQLQAALQQRAQIPGLGIPTDANGNPLVDPAQVGAGVLLPDGTVTPGGPVMAGTLAAPMGGYGGGGGAGFGGAGLPSWLLPAALGGGLLLALTLAKR